jgi:transcriptional regulator GlxA family with amidase domain
MTEPSRTIVFAIFPKVTQLDFTGPLEVLAKLPRTRTVVASAAGGEVVCDGGLTFAGIERLADVETCDVLCVPGGYGQITAMRDPSFMREIVRLGRGAAYVTSVCTGSLILAAAGFLRGKRAACHWMYRSLLAEFGAIPDSGRVVRDGNILTGGGVTAGIDFALVLAAELAGRPAAEAIQLGLEYAPAPSFAAGHPDTAPPDVVESVTARLAEVFEERRRSIAEIVAEGSA